MPVRRAGLHLGEVEDVVDQAAQPLALLDDDGDELLALIGVEIRIVAQDLAERADRGQRRADLVADRGHEIVLHLVELLEALVGRPQLGRGRLELPRFLLELARIDDELRGLVEDLHDLVDVVHLLAQHRGHHDARGRRADGAGKLPLGIGDDVGVGRAVVVQAAPVLALEARESRIGARVADEADEQLPQIADRRAPAPDAAGLRRALEDVDELHRLAALDDRLRGQQRDADEQPDVDQHGPDRGMRDRIQPLEPEQRVGLEQGETRTGRSRRSSELIQPERANDGSSSV